MKYKNWYVNLAFSFIMTILVFAVDLITKSYRFSISEAVLLFGIIWIILNQFNLMEANKC